MNKLESKKELQFFAEKRRRRGGLVSRTAKIERSGVSLKRYTRTIMEESGEGGNDSLARARSGKPPKHGGTHFPTRERQRPVMSMALPASVSQGLRYFEFVKESEEDVTECSPRGVLEDCQRSSDTETSSKASTSYAETQQMRRDSPWQGFFKLWKHKSIRRFSSFPPFGFRKLSRKWSREARTHEADSSALAAGGDEKSCILKPSWRNFTTAELATATYNFSPANMIGKGGSSEIYKGCLEDGQLVAVKRITKGTTEEKIYSFLSEMGVLGHLDHPNTARLVGVGVEGMHLVLVLSPYGSLENLLHDSKSKLDWEKRYSIAVGTAKGLEYLHEKCQRRIIHRDIKASNILITEDFEPQICDFGLAKWLPDEITHHILPSFEGTFGYLAPEYCMHGVVDEKTDVFAFGVLLLEIISGRKAIDSSQQSLLLWAKPLLEQNKVKDLIDPCLGDSYDSKQLHYATNAAHLCIQHSSVLRPRMSQVLELLRGKEDQAESTRTRQRPFTRRTYSEETFDAEEYNATKYLNDMRRHKQIALDF